MYKEHICISVYNTCSGWSTLGASRVSTEGAWSTADNRTDSHRSHTNMFHPSTSGSSGDPFFCREWGRSQIIAKSVCETYGKSLFLQWWYTGPVMVISGSSLCVLHSCVVHHQIRLTFIWFWNVPERIKGTTRFANTIFSNRAMFWEPVASNKYTVYVTCSIFNLAWLIMTPNNISINNQRTDESNSPCEPSGWHVPPFEYNRKHEIDGMMKYENSWKINSYILVVLAPMQQPLNYSF